MAYFIICGQPDCREFAHAIYAAQYMSDHLPNFKFKKIVVSKTNWQKHVNALNKKHHWVMVSSPIIWKEISQWGGKPYLLGGLSEFWEHCYCYYGLESKIPKLDLTTLVADNLKSFEEEQEKKLHKVYQIVITIMFKQNQLIFVSHLIEELLQIDDFHKKSGMFIKLFEGPLEDIALKREKIGLDDIETDYNSRGIYGDREMIKYVTTEVDAINDSDLLIFIEDFSHIQSENYHEWLTRCKTRMSSLADTINIYGQCELKMVFSNEGPSCFMATCLLEYCTTILPANILVVTADRGLSVISVISKMTEIPVARIGAPPVWGFVGTNEYIDEANLVFMAHVDKPYQRALTAPKNSSLPLGRVMPELRLLAYKLPNKHHEITKTVLENQKNVEKHLGRKPFLSKLRSLKSLLSLWFSEHTSNHVISLGVCSDGSNGVPSGLIISQPCILDKHRRWKPYPDYPLKDQTTLEHLQKCIDEAVRLIKYMGLHRGKQTTGSQLNLSGLS